MLPVTDERKTLELLHLRVDKALSELFASRTELGNAHLLAVDLVLLENSRLDRHTVVIPAGNVRDLMSGHRLILVDEVLYGLVECVTHVNITV